MSRASDEEWKGPFQEANPALGCCNVFSQLILTCSFVLRVK